MEIRSEAKIFRTYRTTRIYHYFLAGLAVIPIIVMMFYSRNTSLDSFSSSLFLGLLILAISSNLHREKKKTALEEVHVEKDVVSAWYSDGKLVVVNRGDGVNFTEYGDCILIAFKAFDRPQTLKLAKWQFEPEVWRALLEEIRQVIKG